VNNPVQFKWSTLERKLKLTTLQLSRTRKERPATSPC